MNSMRQPVRFYSLWGAAAFVIGLLLFQPDTAVGQVTGSGTINKIPKWTATTTLGDSAIAESSNNVGIGTSAPTAQLHITRELRIDGTDVTNGYRAIGFGGNSLGVNPTIYSSGNYLVVNSAGGHPLYLNFDNSNGNTLLQSNGGNVGIGTTSPAFKLHLSGGRQLISPTAETLALGLSRTDISGKFWLGVSGNASPDLILTNNSFTERVRITDAGRVGIGTTSPSTQLHVVGDITGTGSANFTLAGTGANAANITVTGTGTTSGNITATGTIQGGNVIAKYQDVAEWVPASRAIPAGTVVSLDPEHSNHVLPSTRAYDTRVAGVISASPGVLLGEGGAGKVMVASTGRVRVKVDATAAPIRVGDLLVTSNKVGIAMRSQPLDLAGTPIHRPGTLIGKALEPLAKGVGEILVLLSLH